MRMPNLKPSPNAVLVSLVTETLASLHVSLSIAWLSASKSDPSAGNRPEKTMCFTGLKPITRENVTKRSKHNRQAIAYNNLVKNRMLHATLSKSYVHKIYPICSPK